MSPSLLGLEVSSALAATTASWGAARGALRWPQLTKSQRWTAAFLMLSALSAFIGEALCHLGFTNAWVGNVWQLGIPGLLMPALISEMPAAQRGVYRAVQRVAVLMWIIYFLLLWRINEFTTFYHASACIATVLLALTLLFEECYRPGKLRSRPAFVLGVGAALACAFDVIPHSSFIFWAMHGKASFVALWVIRNSVWAVGYAIIAYSLVLRPQHE